MSLISSCESVMVGCFVCCLSLVCVLNQKNALAYRTVALAVVGGQTSDAEIQI